MRLRIRRRLARAAALILVASGIVAQPTAAMANPPEPIRWSEANVPSKHLGVVGRNDGSVVACGSNSGPNATTTFETDSDEVGAVNFSGTPYAWMPAFDMCGNVGAVDAGGDLYGIDYKSYPTQKVARYDGDYTGGTPAWASSVTIPGCSNSLQTPMYVRIGSDSNVYVASSPQGGSCSQANHYFVTSYTSGGAFRWQVSVGTSYLESITPYVGGVVVGTYQTLHYIDNDGTYHTPVTISESRPVVLADLAVNHNGEVVVGVYGPMPPSCSSSWTGTLAVAVYDVSGFVDRHTPPACTYGGGFKWLSNGFVTFMQGDTANVTHMVTLDVALNVERQLPMSAETIAGRSYMHGAGFFPDTNGNVVAWRSFQYAHQSSQRRGVEFMLLDPQTGDVLSRFRTDQIAVGKSFSMPDPGSVTTTPGALYFAARVCQAYTCSSTDAVDIYSIRWGKEGMDYPRGTVLGATATTHDDMAIAGDSFTAGIGSLLSGQTYVDANCSRSPNAYGPQLATSPQVKLRLPSGQFVACSGAKTTDMAGQIAAIDADAAAVFLTIGGNDVEFARLGVLCIFIDCSATVYQTEFDGYLSTLQDKLVGVYQGVLSKAGNAKVYVIGYPHILPLANCPNAGGGPWWGQLAALQASQTTYPAFVGLGDEAGLTSAEATSHAMEVPINISSAEATFVSTFENELNLILSDAVDEVDNPRLVYVSATALGSPLTDHQLCSEEPYFNGLTGGSEQGNTFHPNHLGQEALKQLAFDALETHQPEYVLAG